MNWRVTQTDREAGVVLLACPGLNWDSFPVLAKELVEGWELIPLEQEWGADRGLVDQIQSRILAPQPAGRA